MKVLLCVLTGLESFTQNQEGYDEEMEKLKKSLHEERIKKVEAINKLAEVSESRCHTAHTTPV